MLPGAGWALAVEQGSSTLHFGVFGPSGAAAVLAQLGKLLFAAIHAHRRQAQA